ncbi:ABC transporter ATP-binding protein [Sedimenticola selenatireducens]|uniref:ABC transporter ATP-binding protein n=1 Tax=Sedimenticola selenatireducens TaxID=191960 RepID=UPI0021B3F190|nr:ABC transporter ATP-binding protein [Sedimenticola selenatireducens]
MHEPVAIRLKDVSKIYKLHGSQGDQLIEILGLRRFGFKTKSAAKEFAALSEISLDVPRGHRIGIVGRNGAGKTTLLKLICGNYSPTHGSVEINGTVQALMSVGLGFHPEYTGRENIEASLQYNGLRQDEYKEAIDEIIEFCELGEFIDQPFKTYSLGMQARLMFAAATAVQPDILIVDEVLGAGDAYFVAKSKARVEKLVSSGCTMLLVSHSMQQILELCDEAIWLDQGAIRMHDNAFLVVKAYEEHLQGPIKHASSVMSERFVGKENELELNLNNASDYPEKLLTEKRGLELPKSIRLQEPEFMPHSMATCFPDTELIDTLDFVAPGGISRWNSDAGLKVCGFTVIGERGRTNKLFTLQPAKIAISIIAEESGKYDCRYGIVVDDMMGRSVIRIFSPADQFNIIKGAKRNIEIVLNPLQIGPGEYTIGVSILANAPIQYLQNTSRYDLLSRSFSISVELPSSLSLFGAAFMHSAEWNFS